MCPLTRKNIFFAIFLDIRVNEGGRLYEISLENSMRVCHGGLEKTGCAFSMKI